MIVKLQKALKQMDVIRKVATSMFMLNSKFHSNDYACNTCIVLAEAVLVY